MDVKNNGNLIIAENSETDIPEKNINILSDKVSYNKEKQIIIFKNNVLLSDKNAGILIRSNNIKYNRLKDFNI